MSNLICLDASHCDIMLNSVEALLCVSNKCCVLFWLAVKVLVNKFDHIRACGQKMGFLCFSEDGSNSRLYYMVSLTIIC